MLMLGRRQRSHRSLGLRIVLSLVSPFPCSDRREDQRCSQMPCERDEDTRAPAWAELGNRHTEVAELLFPKSGVLLLHGGQSQKDFPEFRRPLSFSKASIQRSAVDSSWRFFR